MRISGLALVAAFTACGGTSKDATPGDGGNLDEGAPLVPPVTCDIPAEGKLVDVSGTTNAVGDGTPAHHHVT